MSWELSTSAGRWSRRCSGGGAARCCSSPAAEEVPRFPVSAYASSKAAIVRLAETLAEEVREAGVQVNALAPGPVDTRLLREIEAAGPRAGGHAEWVRDARRRDELTPIAEVAALARFLASPASGKLTGKLVSARHDRWRDWAGRADELNRSPLYTVRRLDPFTLESLTSPPRSS